MKKIIIVFFGASVTQQSTDRNGVEVGYVPNSIQILSDEFGTDKFEFHQLGYGSNHFNDAGFIRFNEVLELKPNVVVMEWHSTGIASFDSAKYDFVITKLHGMDCKVISLILPLRRCIGQPERENVKQSRWYQKKGVIQVNFYSLIGREIDVDACLRDEVHTNETGGIKYGEIVASVVSDVLQGKKIDCDFGDEIEPTSNYSNAPLVSSFDLEGGNLDYDQKLVVKFQATGSVQLFVDSVIGPYSPVLDVECGEKKHTVSIWDQWCKYERRCLKPLTQIVAHHEGLITLSISDEQAVYDNGQTKPSLNNKHQGKLRGIEKLFMAGGQIVAVDFQKKHNESKVKVLVFANCHGVLYKEALNKADRDGRLEVEHIISYENISKFDEIKIKFLQCDILIIQPVTNYNEFKLESLKRILKSDCVIIRVPFVRFDGFWDVGDVRVLKKFAQSAVMFFPNIRHVNEVGDYLRGDNCAEIDIKRRFDLAVAEFKALENQGDVKFIDFFMKNYKSLPLFRDSYHPTKIFYEFLSHQIVGLTKLHEKTLFLDEFRIKDNGNKEYGHFKPIINKVASVLGLQYDLNSYFIYTRYDYLSCIVAHENNVASSLMISNLVDLKKILEPVSNIPNIKSKSADKQTISLFVPYFNASDENRQKELVSCLRKNILNNAIDKIFLLIDDGYIPEIVSDKVEIIVTKGRPTYSDWLKLTKSKCKFGLSVLANSDIYFDESISKLSDLFLTNNEFVALSRYEKIDNNLFLHKNPHWSQDAWVISVKAPMTESLIRMANFMLGIPRCDNKIAYIFSVNGFKLYNPCHDIKSVHLHKSGLRNYNKNDLQLVGMIAFVYPSTGAMESRLDHQLWALRNDQIQRVNINRTLEIISDQKILDGKRVISSGGSVIGHDADWQYPAITEQHAYLSIRDRLGVSDTNFVYFGFPWATLIDLLVHNKDQSPQLMEVLGSYTKLLKKYKRVVTVCQHIHMLRFQDIFYRVGVTDIFWSHAIKGQDRLPNYPLISLFPFPLYPVQAKTGARIIDVPKYLYSFVGARSRSFYLTDSRNKIIDLLSDDSRGFVRGKENWHYNKVVYDHQIKKIANDGGNLIDDGGTKEFTEVMENSIFSLCPSGSGPNSIRLWESLSFGSIPVILADTYLPPGNTGLWEEAAVFCEETDEAIRALPKRLEALSNDPELLARKRHAGRQLMHLYGPNNFVYDIYKLFIGLAGSCYIDSESELPSLAIEKLAFDILSAKQPDVRSMEVMLLAIGSRLLSSPKSFFLLYRDSENIKTASQIALKLLDLDKVEGVLKIAEFKDFKFS